ncbi:MAG TPA: class I SAM-dependent methyltransferase [Opitutales bacterium]|nr:class I SAM-dependent methyltransferase [Opitutales bacterium]
MPQYSPSDLPAVLREMLQTGSYRDQQGVVQTLHSNVSLEEALALYGMVRDLKPKASAEIGFALGISGLAILSALEANGQGRHYVSDPFQTSFVGGMGRENARRAGLEHRLEFYEKFPEEAVPQFPPVQFAFIDASHLFDLSILDFVLVDKRLEVGGVVGFHDLWMPSLRKVVRHILANRAYRVHPASPPGAPLTAKQKFRSGLCAVARQLPWASRWLAPEAARPWHEFRLANLVLLEKIGEDRRDWREHQTF